MSALSPSSLPHLVEESTCLELGGGESLIRIFLGDMMSFSATFIE
jgi:hypothetical protein